MSVQIITDSSTDLNPALRSRVWTVPLPIQFGEESYLDGIDIQPGEFYRKLAASPVLPSTSQPTPYAFCQLFDRAAAAGDTVVCITISRKLSGTYQSAALAAADHPGRVFVVDSGTVALGTGVLTEYALALKDRGLTGEEIALNLLGKRERVQLVAMVDTLEYLKKGGRISPAAAFAGSMLNLKPLIAVEDGILALAGKARGVRQGLAQLTRLIQEKGGIDPEKPLLLGYTGNDDALLRQYISANCPLLSRGAEPLPITQVGSVIGTHAGPGAVALAFFSENPPASGDL